MSHKEILTDDYVAGILAKDAQANSIKYSAIGVDAFAAPSRLPSSKPKPNTRFLRNIIKETDSHNAALLAKEAAESQARLNGLTGNGHREQKASRVDGRDVRRRQLGDIAAYLGGRPTKRKRTENSKKPEQTSRRGNTSSEDEEHRQKRVDLEGRRPGRSQRDGVHGSRSHWIRDHDKDRESVAAEPRPIRRKSISPYRVRYDEEQRRKHRPRSDSWSRSLSPVEDGKKLRESPRRKRRRPESPVSQRGSCNKSRTGAAESSPDKHGLKPAPMVDSKPDYESDPLDEIIGPRPQPVPKLRSRGRGTLSQSSGIDSRFSATYDPSIDVRLDPEEENDWDQALEALQDRMKWKQQGADRLRAAGFTEDEISKWEKGGEKRTEDVKWTKKGEGREWDRGKVLDHDGIVTIDTKFGRLKDT